ncbi:MAG: hypothetical protein WAQ41_00270 [bacterium]|nr:hypothetical protein [Bacillota bacterium]HHW54761.1 hypothetical protein [Bacillota bacterium]
MERIIEWIKSGDVLNIPRPTFETELVRPLREEGYRCPRKVEGEIIGTAHWEDEWIVLEVKTNPGGQVLVRVGISPDGSKFTPAGACTACSWRQVNVVVNFFRRHIR